jgi:hypothetical protein
MLALNLNVRTLKLCCLAHRFDSVPYFYYAQSYASPQPLPQNIEAVLPGTQVRLCPLFLQSLCPIICQRSTSSLGHWSCVSWHTGSTLSLIFIVTFPNHMPALNIYLRTLKLWFLAHRFDSVPYFCNFAQSYASPQPLSKDIEAVVPGTQVRFCPLFL